MKRTEIPNQAYKIDILEHLNEDHAAELLDIAHAFCSPDSQAVNLSDLFAEGALIEADGKEYFVPFNLKGDDLHDKVEFLAYSAKVKLGKPLNAKANHYFEVLKMEKITPNMLRLTLKSEVAIPENEAGFAWDFALKTLEQAPADIAKKAEKLPACGKLFQQIYWWGLKFLSSEKRDRILHSFYKDRRYYTLRKALKSGDKPFCDIAWVDIFLHGDTSGGIWASHLQQGDLIYACAEYHENTDHLHTGQAVLIADETSLPTVADLLEHWQNPKPPIVICLTANSAEQAYLSDEMLPKGSQIHRLIGSQNADDIIALLQNIPCIDNVWGAFEHFTAKAVRLYLRNERDLGAKQNRVKGYWIQS